MVPVRRIYSPHNLQTLFSNAIPLSGASKKDMVRPLGMMAVHVFNHQTHHRGQAHTLLTQSYVEAPDLDLICFVREAWTAAEPAGQPTWSHFRQPASASTASSAALAFSR